MIAGEDDDGVVSLPGFVQSLENPSELIVNLSDHCIIAGLSPFGIVFLGRPDFVLKIAIRYLA